MPAPTRPAELERAPDFSLPVPPPFICSPLGLVGAQQVLLCGPAQEGPLLISSFLCPNCSSPRFPHGNRVPPVRVPHLLLSPSVTSSSHHRPIAPFPSSPTPISLFFPPNDAVDLVLARLSRKRLYFSERMSGLGVKMRLQAGQTCVLVPASSLSQTSLSPSVKWGSESTSPHPRPRSFHAHHWESPEHMASR